MRALEGLLVGAVVVWASGCAFSTMQTPQQLEGSEIVASAAVDVPGGLDDYNPYFSWGEARLGTTRLGAQGLYGVGGYGDVGVHLGASRYAVNGGVSGRYYVDDWLTTGLQVDYMRRLDLVTATPRVITATTDERWYYGGVQSNLFFGTEPHERLMNFLGGTVGVVGGAEYVWHGWSLPVGFHAEAVLSPFYFGHGTGLFLIDDGTAGLYQVGVGANVRF